MKKNLSTSSRQRGFTLIELLVVIAIIGLLSTLAVVALNSARAKSRDAKRIADVKQMQTALELYFNDAGSYPVDATAITLGGTDTKVLCYGTATDGADGFVPTGLPGAGGCDTGATTYMGLVPAAPTPPDGTTCTDTNDYTYTSANGSTYTLTFCLGGQTGGLGAGNVIASPEGITPAPAG